MLLTAATMLGLAGETARAIRPEPEMVWAEVNELPPLVE